MAKQAKVWDGSQWVDVLSSTSKVVYYQPNTPTIANDGDIWIDSDDETITATGPQGPTGATGATGATGPAGTPVYTLTQNQQSGTNYPLVLSDADKLIEMSNAAANTVTVPLNSSVAFPVGQQIHILQTGAGRTQVVATSGVTVNSNVGLYLRGQWSMATLIKRATDTWLLVGDVTA